MAETPEPGHRLTPERGGDVVGSVRADRPMDRLVAVVVVGGASGGRVRATTAGSMRHTAWPVTRAKIHIDRSTTIVSFT